MTPRSANPQSAQRQLRVALRRARVSLNMTQKEVADALDWSNSKLVRIEGGTVGISVTDLKALLLHYGITEADKVDQMVEMARASKKNAWWQTYREYFTPQFIAFLGLEASAVRIRQFQNLVVPGLLQISGYINVLTRLNAGEEHAKRNTEIRLKRQGLIADDNGPEMFFVLDESVLYREVGDITVMRAQLSRIKELAQHPRLSIQILPFSAGVHNGMKSSFEIFEMSNGSDDYALLLERLHDDVLYQDPTDETREFVNYFFELEKIALPAAETPRIIDERLK